MRLLRLTVLVVTFMSFFGVGTAPVLAADCQFVLGFKALHDAIPSIVGDCLVDEHHNPDNGDGLQETTGVAGGNATGLLVWRKADNWTAYTDGYHTWIAGPNGIQERLNTQCFAWESGCNQPASSVRAGFQNFAQSWSHHGFALNVTADGQGNAVWRVYSFCSVSPPPCDQQQGNDLISGGAAHLVFESINGATATANVAASNDANTIVPGSTVTLTLLPYDQAILQGLAGDIGPLTLCGPQYATLAPSDVQATNPCGA